MREMQRYLPGDMIQELLKSESRGRPGGLVGGRTPAAGGSRGDECRGGILGLV